MIIYFPIYYQIQAMDIKTIQQQQSKTIQEKEAAIRQLFMDRNYPYQYISYKHFLQHFKIHQQNFKQENLNIIDVHLRYRWYAREKMAPYKWITILSLTPIFFKSLSLCLFIPIFTVNMFDHYFQRFFVWRYRKDRIINIRNEFIGKLSKQKNKIRRIVLFQNLKHSIHQDQNLNIQNNHTIQTSTIQTSPKNGQKQLTTHNQQTTFQQPLKYIKFGQFTEYLFHANIQGGQQSSLLQTTLFQTYLTFKNIFKEKKTFQFCKQIMKEFKEDFIAFKNDPDRKKYTIDVNTLIQNDQIKQEEIYTLQQNIDHNVRRFIELWQFMRSESLEPSTFNLWEYTNFSRYQDIFDGVKYNVKSNTPDLFLYYSIIFIPKIFSFIFKRR